MDTVIASPTQALFSIIPRNWNWILVSQFEHHYHKAIHLYVAANFIEIRTKYNFQGFKTCMVHMLSIVELGI